MLLLSKVGLRRSAFALAAFATVSMALATPALADHKHHRRHVRYYGGHYWHPPLPRVVVSLPLPPVVVVPGPRPVPEYGYGYERPYDDRPYERGYQHGYEDGYEDSARDAYRRAAYHRHSRGCDHAYYY